MMVGAAASVEGLTKGHLSGLHAKASTTGCRPLNEQAVGGQGVAVRALVKSVKPGRKGWKTSSKHAVVGQTSLGIFAGQTVLDGRVDRQYREGARKPSVQCVHSTHSQSQGGSEDGGWEELFQVSDPREQGVKLKNNWDVVLNDVRYLDWRARQDLYAIKAAHDKVVETLNPIAREHKSVSTLKSQLAELQDELSKAHAQLHVSEARVEHTLSRLTEMEDKLMGTLPPQQRLQTQTQELPRTKPESKEIADMQEEVSRRQRRAGQKSFLNVSGKPKPSAALKDFWYPVAFSDNVDEKTMVPIDCFNEPWVIFRGQDGKAGCIRDECAHRACPLSLGTLVDGKVQCPYHGWEYNTTGACEHMPSTVQAPTSVRALPCVEQDGMIWIWPGDKVPEATLPDLSPPSGYTIHAQITLEVPVEHGLLVENLLDLAHAPFTHTTTFAKGWPVPSSVKFKTAAAAALSGFWDPYPIDMEFRPPCMVFSTIGLSQPGKLSGTNTKDCSKHLHQLHVCVPSKTGTTRLLYRMSLDFAWWAKFVPFIHKLWETMANQVLGEDLRLVEGQQDRMLRGANVWNHPVAYDKLGVRYRRWREQQEAGSQLEHSPIEDDFD